MLLMFLSPATFQRISANFAEVALEFQFKFQFRIFSCFSPSPSSSSRGLLMITEGISEKQTISIFLNILILRIRERAFSNFLTLIFLSRVCCGVQPYMLSQAFSLVGCWGSQY